MFIVARFMMLKMYENTLNCDHAISVFQRIFYLVTENDKIKLEMFQLRDEFTVASLFTFA